MIADSESARIGRKRTGATERTAMAVRPEEAAQCVLVVPSPRHRQVVPALEPTLLEA